METLELIKLISDVGFPIVTAGLFIFLAYRAFNKQQDWLEKFINPTSQATAHPSSEASTQLTVINNKIHSELQMLLHSVAADRTYIVLFHNGGRSTSGLFFQKMSCICEVVSSGIFPFSDHFQNIHCGSYTYMIERLRNEKIIHTIDIKEIQKADSFCYEQLKQRHVSGVFMRSIRDNDDNPIGFVGIDYCGAQPELDVESICTLLKTVTLKISSLVDIRDEVK